jgi:SPP1 gp7 family putative phage head morphogenesis protein
MLPPLALERAYFDALRKGPVETIRKLVEERLVPRLPRLAANARSARGAKARADAVDDEIGDLLDELADSYAETWSRKNAARLAETIAGDLDRFQAYQLNRVLHEIVGVDVVGSEPWLADVIAAFTRENVALIKSLGAETFPKIESLVTRNLVDGERWEEVSTLLQDQLGVTERRANLIARDQAGKLYGDLNRVRQTDLGLGAYLWRTMRDNRVRDEHETRDGERYTWDDPPEDGHPGEAILCRCYAEPDLAPLLKEIEP